MLKTAGCRDSHFLIPAASLAKAVYLPCGLRPSLALRRGSDRVSGVPIVSAFFGIVVRVYHEEHPPPHIHVQYAEFAAVIEIDTGRTLAGRLPRTAAALVERWRSLHEAELRKAWGTAQNGRIPKRIAPLR